MVKTLIITDYLLKYGCSGIIDDLKVRVSMFTLLSNYHSNSKVPLHVLSKFQIKAVRDKSKHIGNQLTNRALLYREKEIAKQIKVKLRMNKTRLQGIQGGGDDQERRETTVDDILENYVFKYLDKINERLDEWGDKINQKLDNLIENMVHEE